MNKAIRLIVVLVVLFALAELTLLLPAFSPTNPPVTHQIAWDSPETQALFTRACADCHSNETVWPWYSYVVPVAWLVTHDVQEGREKFNISTGNLEESHEIFEVIKEGEMPLPVYLPMHPEAVLTDDEKQQLVAGLERSLSASSGGNAEDDDSD